MRKSSDTAEAIALYLLKGKKIHRVEPDRRTMTDKQLYRAGRDRNNERVER